MDKVQEATDIEVKHILDEYLTYSSELSATVISRLEKMGFEEIGTGTHAYVFRKKGYKRVIKLTYYPDLGGYWWMEYAKKNSRKNPYLPKVYYFKGLKARGRYVAVIEYLDEFDKYDYRDLPRDERDIMDVLYDPWENTYIRSEELMASEKFRKLHENYKNHDLFKLLALLHRKKGRRKMDISFANIRKRVSNGRLVINDPLAAS